MRRSYEILCDPTDRYLLWDLSDDAPVVSANRIVTFPGLTDSCRFLESLQQQQVHPVPAHWCVIENANDNGG